MSEAINNTHAEEVVAEILPPVPNGNHVVTSAPAVPESSEHASSTFVKVSSDVTVVENKSNTPSTENVMKNSIPTASNKEKELAKEKESSIEVEVANTNDDDMIPSSVIIPKNQNENKNENKKKSFTSAAICVTAAVKFNQVNTTAEVQKCPLCYKSVYSVERVVCGQSAWHKSCFGKLLNFNFNLDIEN